MFHMKKKTLAAQVIGLLCAAIAVWTGINVSRLRRIAPDRQARTREELIDALRISVPFQLPRFGGFWFWEVWRFWELRPSELPT